MPNPYKIYDKNNGPKWLDGLQKYVVKPASEDCEKRDNAATVRYSGGDRSAIDEATYVEKGRK
jgi:hypothetical protein